jgi:hypothetical protein
MRSAQYVARIREYERLVYNFVVYVDLYFLLIIIIIIIIIIILLLRFCC